MPVHLKKRGDVLAAKLSGYDSRSDFNDDLKRVKEAIEFGRRWNPDEKEWEFPATAENAIKIMNKVEPVASAEVQAMVQAAQHETTESLITPIGDDGELRHPALRDILFPYQRAFVAWAQDHPHALLCDDMGVGKTIQMIATVLEAKLRCSYEHTSNNAVVPSESRTASRTGAQGTSEAASEDEGDHSGSEGSSVRGLRDAASAATHGSGSRARGEAVRAGAVDEVSQASGVQDDGGSDSRGDREVRGPLSELPSAASLPTLVICPNGLRKRWRREIIHGPCDRDGQPIYPDWPGSDVQILDGKNPGARRAQLAEPADFYITNWEKLRTDHFLAEHEWCAILADEMHRAKNRDAQQAAPLVGEHEKGRAHRPPALTAPIQIGASGTPLMNTPDELWSLLRWMHPEQYTSFWKFHYDYVDEYPTKYGRVMRGVKNPDALRFELGNRMVRRTKKLVLPDLPDKLPPEVIEVDLNDSERKLYEEAEDALLLDVVNFARKQAEESVSESEPDREPIIRDRAAAIAEELAALPLERLQGTIDNGGARITALRQITAQAKAREAVEIIRDNLGKPFVVFTWYVPPARWISEQLQASKQSVSLIAGPGGDPEESARAFQASETDQCVCTLAKGGIGIDLYRSSTAIFADEDWVPDINRQALDRLHRKGQTNAVSSIILRVPGTVDTGKVAPANAFKEAIQRAVFGG